MLRLCEIKKKKKKSWKCTQFLFIIILHLSVNKGSFNLSRQFTTRFFLDLFPFLWQNLSVAL